MRTPLPVIQISAILVHCRRVCIMHVNKYVYVVIVAVLVVTVVMTTIATI